MKVVIQRVTRASVTIEQQLFSSIGKGMLILVGIQSDDTDDDINWLTSKIVNLRIFDDENGVMNKIFCKITEMINESISKYLLMQLLPLSLSRYMKNL